MLDLADQLARLETEAAPVRRRWIDQAVDLYRRRLLAASDPAEACQGAQAAAYTHLSDAMLGSECRRRLVPDRVLDDRQAAAAAVTFHRLCPPVPLPQPTTRRVVSPRTAALAAAVGALIGVCLLTPLARWTLLMRDVGLFAGGPLGAALAALWAGHGRWGVRRRSRMSPADWPSHAEAVRQVLEAWARWATTVLWLLWHQDALADTETDAGRLLQRLSRRLSDLMTVSAEQLPVAVDELLQEARNAGLGGLEGTPAFLDPERKRPQAVWSEAMAAQYECFGHVEPGDPVWVERQPVLLGQRVVQRGLVRKVRS